MAERWWTAQEVGERFFIPLRLVEWWVRSGQLPGVEGVLIAERNLKHLFEMERRWIEEGFTREDASELGALVDRSNQRYREEEEA